MPKKEAVPAVAMRVIKVSDTPSLSGRSQLTYHVGCDAEGAISIKVASNSASGQFNADWIPLSMIEKLLSGHPEGKPLTSSALRPAYRGKSSNSPAFLFAALKVEGLVKPSADKDGGYVNGDIEAFKQTTSTLIASNTNLDASITPEVSRRKRKET